MSIIVKNDTAYVQKVQYREKGKFYGSPSDNEIGTPGAPVPFEEAFIQPGESFEIKNLRSNWFKVIDMIPGADTSSEELYVAG